MRIFLLSVALGSFFSSAAANAQILSVCGKPETLSTVSYGTPTIWQRGEEPIPEALGSRSQIALLRDASGFDVVLNWGETSQVSLRAQGAQIMGNEMGADLVHLIVARPASHSLEHFLFTFEDDAAGELIWNGSSDGDDEGVVSYETSCTKPK